MKVGDLVIKKGEWVMTNNFMKGTELDDTDYDNYGIIINTGLDQFEKPAAHVVWVKDDSESIHQQEELEVVCK